MAENRTRSSPAKKTTKKSTSKKTSSSGDDDTPRKTAQKTAQKTAKKTARKSTAKTADSATAHNSDQATKKTAKASAQSDPRGPSRRSSSGSRLRAADVMASAVEQLRQLLGRGVESVSAIQREDDGWRVEVEVVELERVPQTTDVMGGYEVQLDDSGELMGYRRVRRYVRGSTEGAER